MHTNEVASPSQDLQEWAVRIKDLREQTLREVSRVVVGMERVTTRFLIALHEVPSSALLPELTRDYHGRTTLVSIRWFFFTLGGATATVLTYNVFLKSSPQIFGNWES